MNVSYTEEIYKTYSTPKHRLGAKLEFPDGRMFRFALAGAVALAPGKLHQMPVPAANHTDIAVAAAAAIGATRVSVTLGATAAAENLYKDGYLLVNDDTGEGHYYRIKSHLLIGSGGTGWINLYEDSPIKVALVNGSTTVTLVRNPFAQVIIHPSPPTAKIAGVTLVNVSANAYCWLQTRGPCAVLTNGTLVAGDHAVPSTAVDGSVMPSAAFETDGPSVGKVITVNADTEYSLIDLYIE